jgi:hypothetical protein
MNIDQIGCGRSGLAYHRSKTGRRSGPVVAVKTVQLTTQSTVIWLQVRKLERLLGR